MEGIRKMTDVNTLARLDNLEVRLYRLTTKSHLRIGAGEGTADISAAENPIIRALIYTDGEEKRVPYLPGSSLHGVIRSWVEKALRSREQPIGREKRAQMLADITELKEALQREIGAFLGKEDPANEDILDHWQIHQHVCNPLLQADQCERVTLRDESRLWKQTYWDAINRPMPCHVCDIFGYSGQRGRVKVSHAFPAYPLGDQMPVDVITRVAINRLTGAADEGKLFDLEAIPPGVPFYYFVVMENLTSSQKDNFDKGIRAMSLQLAGVGAHGTIGFGMVDVNRIYSAHIDSAIFDDPLEDQLPSLLKQKDYKIQDLKLDFSKYPDFFLALTGAYTQQTKSPFNGHVEFLNTDE
jgi:CRISPR/Cas system CSM-associated protein Csm3 (group 7 of RAMP superfamily)